YNSAPSPRGLYLAINDPMGSIKDMTLEVDAKTHCARLRFEHPVPNRGLAKTGFVLNGEAVWQLLRGDWFDAAMIYKNWVRQNARWWPRLGPDGRSDTPLWMRELSAWVQRGGTPEECVPAVEEFQRFVGVPTGFHWYGWHQIPFDNDYPHYFPPKTNFANAVKELQESNVFVMPYINGRLWDTHDRGTDDFEFSRVALPAATKDPDGRPYIEIYGSKETNGNPVQLAVMCPTTSLWQKTVHDVVLGLLGKEGTRAVYIDQVAAAPPQLCMDASHGHPLGGGHWWNEGYWRMLDAIRRDMPPDRMLTTECNAEPFVRWFDGYLTWHWQFDEQVPVFPAVYGGAVQMFGRAYRGGPTKDLALRMKAGQQFVFGEQIGWFDPNVIENKQNAAFLRQVIRLRWGLRRYFYAGEMARPPRLSGPMPRLTADWQWSGKWLVTKDAVLTGAWKIPAEQRLVLLFVNMSDQPVSSILDFDPAQYGLADHTYKCVTIKQPGDASEPQSRTGPFKQSVTFAPLEAVAWELRW
ncbi:MAG: DUF6259 domain-containing protein, partial [Candidatus Omnitrophica bacterium]|nr:DUF6259 domain-containing protein [Candidatus Omnitrophota bacterium]